MDGQFKSLMQKLGAEPDAIDQMAQKGITTFDKFTDVEEDELPNRKVQLIWNNIMDDLANLDEGDIYENIESRLDDFAVKVTKCDAMPFTGTAAAPLKNFKPTVPEPNKAQQSRVTDQSFTKAVQPSC